MPDLPAAEMRPVFFVKKSAKDTEKVKIRYIGKRSGEVECGEEKRKIKNKKQKENRKRIRKVGGCKVVTGAEGALTEGCRERKVEVCSVRKDVTGGSFLVG